LNKFSTVFRQPHKSTGEIQPLLLFLMGLGFVALGLRSYPAFIGVGGLFLIIGYRGYTCRTTKVSEQK
jgi:hypothetical protein